MPSTHGRGENRDSRAFHHDVADAFNEPDAEERSHDASLRETAARLEDLPPADAADALAAMPIERAADVAEYIDPGTAAAILTRADAERAADVIRAMHPPEASMVLSAMDPDDRVDVLAHLGRPLHDEIVGEMTPADATDVRRLEQYPPDTAGGIMTTQVTALPERLTIAQATEELRRISRQQEQVYYVYTVDDRGRLNGVVSMRDLILAQPDATLSRIEQHDVVTVPATMDQEQVARLMGRLGYVALPVVDEDRRLLGIITVDDIVDVMEEEAREDVQRLFGAGPEERLTSPWSYSFKRRIIWLEVNLLTAFVAASVVGLFEATIAQIAILAMYMPIVAGMGGNASAQAMAVAIRGIAMGEVDRRILVRVLKRELIVGVLTGVCVGATAVLISMVFHYEHGLLLGVLAGVALLVNHTLASVWGVAIPFLMKRLGFDPAQSATIFTTTLTDMVGFFTLLGLATLAMRWLT
jgi:magnesium transporter